MTMKISVGFLSFWLLLSLSYLPISYGQTCDQCFFDENDADDCKVYGRLNRESEPIAWSKASQDCLDFYDINIQTIDPVQLMLMFPNADGTGGSPTAFVNWLRFESGTAASSIKLGFPQFWDENDQGMVILLPTITAVDGTIVDCEASQSNCYTAIREYFSVEPGASEMAAVGVTLYARLRFERELEQSTLRIRLCREEQPAEVCKPLSDEVKALQAEMPDVTCPAVGIGPGDGFLAPGCEGSASTPTMPPTTSPPIGPTMPPTTSPPGSPTMPPSSSPPVFVASTLLFGLGGLLMYWID